MRHVAGLRSARGYAWNTMRMGDQWSISGPLPYSLSATGRKKTGLSSLQRVRVNYIHTSKNSGRGRRWMESCGGGVEPSNGLEQDLLRRAPPHVWISFTSVVCRNVPELIARHPLRDHHDFSRWSHMWISYFFSPRSSANWRRGRGVILKITLRPSFRVRQNDLTTGQANLLVSIGWPPHRPSQNDTVHLLDGF